MTQARLYLVGGIAAVILALIAVVAVQSARLSHAKADLKSTRQALQVAETGLAIAKATIAARDAKARTDAALAATEADQMAVLFKSTCKGALNAGFASRRCPDGSATDGLPDLRAAQSSGRFVPSSDLSAQPVSPHQP